MSRDAKHGGGIARCAVAGVMTCLATSLALLSLISVIVVAGRAGENQSDKFILFVWAISGTLGTLMSKKMNRENHKWLPVYAMGGYAGALFVCGMLIFDGTLYRPWLSVVCVAVGGIFGSELWKGDTKKRKRRSATR